MLRARFFIGGWHDMIEMIEPKQIEVNGRTYIISKVPAVEGREILAKYPLSNIPKIGEYDQSEAVMLKLMAYVQTGEGIPLTTRALVNNHVPDAHTLVMIEKEMLEYNFSFFVRALSSGFFGSFSQKVEQWTSKTLTPLLEQLSQAAAQASMSSKRDTH